MCVCPCCVYQPCLCVFVSVECLDVLYFALCVCTCTYFVCKNRLSHFWFRLNLTIIRWNATYPAPAKPQTTPMRANTMSSTMSKGKSERKLVLNKAVIVMSNQEKQSEQLSLLRHLTSKYSQLKRDKKKREKRRKERREEKQHQPLAWIQTPRSRQTVAPQQAAKNPRQ